MSQRSPGSTPRASALARALATWLAKVSSIGLGTPVVPELRITVCTASGSTALARARHRPRAPSGGADTTRPGNARRRARVERGERGAQPRQRVQQLAEGEPRRKRGGHHVARPPLRASAAGARSGPPPRVARHRSARARRPPRPGGRGGRAPRRSATRPAQLSYGAMPSGDWTEEQSARRIRPAAEWTPAGDYEDIRYETADGIAKITIDRPEVRNAFRPQTVVELSGALERAREDTEVGVVVLTGEGPLAFCSGGDQRVRGDSGYLADDESGRRGDRPLPRDRPARPDAPPAQAARGHGGRVRDRRRPRAPRALRPHDRGRQRPLRPDRAEGGQLRRRLRRRRARRPGGPEEGQGDLVPLPPVRRRPGRARWAS